MSRPAPIFYLILLSSIVLGCVRNEPIEEINFSVSEEGAYQLVCKIPEQDFIKDVLNGYTDPMLRRISGEILEDCPNPKKFFEEIIEYSETEEYDIVKYFHKGNPEMFEINDRPDALRTKLENEYFKCIQEMADLIVSSLKAADVIYNYRIRSDYILEFEVQESDENNASSIRAMVLFPFNLEIATIEIVNDKLELLIKMDSLNFYEKNGSCYLADSSDLLKESPSNHVCWEKTTEQGIETISLSRSTLFDGLLDLPVLEGIYNTSSCYVNLIPSSSMLGTCEPSDTAKINEYINRCRGEFVGVEPLRWKTQFGLDGDVFYCTLVSVREDTDKKEILANEVFHINEFLAEDGETVDLELLMTLEGLDKWHELADQKTTREIVVLMNDQIIGSPPIFDANYKVVQYIYLYGLDKAVAEHLKLGIAVSRGFKLDIVSENWIAPS